VAAQRKDAWDFHGFVKAFTGPTSQDSDELTGLKEAMEQVVDWLHQDQIKETQQLSFSL
jgi:hypothetical protein